MSRAEERALIDSRLACPLPRVTPPPGVRPSPVRVRLTARGRRLFETLDAAAERSVELRARAAAETRAAFTRTLPYRDD